MNFYISDITINKLLTSGIRPEQMLVNAYTGSKLSDKEAKKLWNQINEHKWYMSRDLDRDVGIHVAAIDYLENFHIHNSIKDEGSTTMKALRYTGKKAGKALKWYLENKGDAQVL